MFQTFTCRLHLDFKQTSILLQLLAKPELGTTPAQACFCAFPFLFSRLKDERISLRVFKLRQAASINPNVSFSCAWISLNSPNYLYFYPKYYFQRRQIAVGRSVGLCVCVCFCSFCMSELPTPIKDTEH